MRSFLFFLFVCLSQNSNAQISEQLRQDTLFFTKKSNPKLLIKLPTNKVEVQITWKDGTTTGAYITNIDKDSITAKIYADEYYLRKEKRKARREITKDKTLTHKQKVIKRRALYFTEIKKEAYSDIIQIRINSRDLKGIRKLLYVGDVFCCISPFAGLTISILTIQVPPAQAKLGAFAIVGIIIIDAAIILINEFNRFIIIRPNEWEHTHTFKNKDY